MAKVTSKTCSIEKYLEHVRVKLKTKPEYCEFMKRTSPRRWKQIAYAQKQRAVQKLSSDLLGTCARETTIVVWGDGSFGPTSRGHASAPNKGLRNLLRPYLNIVLGCEFNTSQVCCCHHEKVSTLRTERYHRRTTVVQCKKNKTLLARDANAAQNILDIFLSPEIPEWATRSSSTDKSSEHH